MIQFGLGLIVLLVILVVMSLKILREYERAVVFFLGRFQRVFGPGLIFIIPGVQQFVRVDLRTRVFDVPPQEMEAFVSALLAVRAPGDLRVVTDRWGVRRTSPRFWETIDLIQADVAETNPTEASLFDLNRYGNL